MHNQKRVEESVTEINEVRMEVVFWKYSNAAAQQYSMIAGVLSKSVEDYYTESENPPKLP